jgi:hypothetical protein
MSVPSIDEKRAVVWTWRLISWIRQAQDGTEHRNLVFGVPGETRITASDSSRSPYRT